MAEPGGPTRDSWELTGLSQVVFTQVFSWGFRKTAAGLVAFSKSSLLSWWLLMAVGWGFSLASSAKIHSCGLIMWPGLTHSMVAGLPGKAYQERSDVGCTAFYDLV